MAWVKLDDQFPDHPKVEAAGPLAAWLFVCGLCYCGEHLTDGFIPETKAPRLANVSQPGRQINRLCEVGLWEQVPGGYRVPGYLDYQPSADRVKAERRAAAERMASKRSSSPEVRPNTNGSSSSPAPSLEVPCGTSVVADKPPPATKPKKRATATPAEFSVTPEMRQWAREAGIGVHLGHETAKFLDHHRAKGNTFQNWLAAWQNWMRRAQEYAGDKVPQQATGPRADRCELCDDVLGAGHTDWSCKVGQRAKAETA